jgi:hypothetical protein
MTVSAMVNRIDLRAEFLQSDRARFFAEFTLSA